jgi:peptide-methionine (R)-S-oxide reductase
MEYTRRELIGAGTATALGLVLATSFVGRAMAAKGKFPLMLTDAQWQKKLGANSDTYAVLRKEGTETPGSSPLVNEHRAGTFFCAGCDTPKFSSKTKFDSHTGWPSFWQALPNAVGYEQDDSAGFPRTEVHCANCGGHLGHRFDDGPKPTGWRYCMNGVALRFKAGAA